MTNIIKYALVLCISFIVQIHIDGQHKFEERGFEKTDSETPQKIQINKDVNKLLYQNRSEEDSKISPFDKKKTLQWSKDIEHQLLKISKNKNGQIQSIQGKIGLPDTKSALGSAYAYMDAIKDIVKWKVPVEEFHVKQVVTDQHNHQHVKLQQEHNLYPIFGNEIVVHLSDGSPYALNGKIESSYTTKLPNNIISEEKAINIAKANYPHFKNIKKKQQIDIIGTQVEAEIGWEVNDKSNDLDLVYRIDLRPSIAEHYKVTVDAQTGEILESLNQICKFHNHHEPPSKAKSTADGSFVTNATDLNNQTISLRGYECQDSYFMIDASRDMFSGNQADCSNGDALLQGVILTLDALGTSPADEVNFDYNIVSSSNPNIWNDARAVSAHFNGAQAYEYFKNTFNRESINGRGQDIISFINVVEDNGQQMDNAFWTGQAIFYGNGDEAFSSPLSKSLDVAGHEMSHGVVQSTANLEYRDESGALNESFADIFAAMIDREDWQIGEDIVNRNIFRTGALRDMSNPNNGGRQLGDAGYQPAHVNEQFRGQEDQGGVHINSGIPNLAFHNFAIQVGKQTAEQVYFSALSNFLTSRSNFADLRVAVEMAAEPFGANVVSAARTAFESVGIGDTGTTGPTETLPENPGEEFILVSNSDLSGIANIDLDGTLDMFLSRTQHISRPSISDDGSFIVFVGADRRIHVVQVDWTQNRVEQEFTLSDQAIFRNAVINKQANRVAALTGNLQQNQFEDEIVVFDFTTSPATQKTFPLYNPTYSQGITTGEVLFADAMEFDVTGEYLMYDAFNNLSGSFGQDISYWDIGIMQVWEDDRKAFANEANNIFKLINGLPENVSIGNPTFSKNNPDIIAFDYIETDAFSGSESFAILGMNTSTTDIQLIEDNLQKPGFPAYTVDDEFVLFSDQAANSNAESISFVGVDDSKIVGNTQRGSFIDGAEWAIPFATGKRVLTNVFDTELSEDLIITPNPASDNIEIQLPEGVQGRGQLILYDILGNKILSEDILESSNKIGLNISPLVAGIYYVGFKGDQITYLSKLVIQQ